MKILCMVVCCFICCPVLRGQDTHYWTLLPGSRSALMGGAVYGGTRDNTAVFYNPASLGFIDTASISVNASLYRLDRIRIEDAVGRRRDFNSSHFSTFPLLLSGSFRTHNPRWKVGYGVTTSVDFDFNATARLDADVPIVADTESPGAEAFIGQASVSSDVHETAAGMAIAYELGEHWSVGVTNIVTVRNAAYIRASLARFYLNTAGSPLVSGDIIQSFRYYHFRYALRMGLQWHGEHADIGIAITSPGLCLAGKGAVMADVTANDIMFNGTRTDMMANDRQVKLRAGFRAPVNIAAGANFSFRRASLGLAVQYYGRENVYDVIQAKPAAFARPPELYPALGSDAFLRVRGGAKPVLNAAIGYEQELRSYLTLYGSVRTDMTYYDKDMSELRGIKPDIASWNIYHLVLGGIWRRGRSALSIGLQVSAGKDDKKKQDGNLSQPSEANFLQGSTVITKASYSAAGLMLGYSFSFRK